MNSYYILDEKNNTWSRQHYPLHAILARPGIADSHLLADAHTGKTLTVAQARSHKKPRLTPPEQSLLKGCVAHTVKPKAERATAPKHKAAETPRKVPGEHRFPTEYKVLSQYDSCFGGRFDADALAHALNVHSRQGWHVLSCQMAAVSTDSGELREELLVVLQR